MPAVSGTMCTCRHELAEHEPTNFNTLPCDVRGCICLQFTALCPNCRSMDGNFTPRRRNGCFAAPPTRDADGHHPDCARQH